MTREWTPRIRAVLLISVVITGAYWAAHYGTKHVDRGEQIYITSIEGMERIIPQKSLVVGMQMTGAIRYYTNRYAVRYDMIDPDKFQVLRAHAALTGHRWYALISDFEQEEFRGRTGAEWTEINRWKDVALYRLGSP